MNATAFLHCLEVVNLHVCRSACGEGQGNQATICRPSNLRTAALLTCRVQPAKSKLRLLKTGCRQISGHNAQLAIPAAGLIPRAG